MVKIGVYIKLDEQQLSTIKAMGINFSEWVREKVDEELFDAEKLKIKIKENEAKLKKMRQNLALFDKSVYTGIYTNSPCNYKEIKFLRETAILLKNSPEFLEGRINLYINQFGKTLKPTKKQFKELLNNLPEEIRDEQTDN